MIKHKNYPNFRSVTSRREHGRVIFEISPVSNYGSYLFGLLLVSAVFVAGSWVLVGAILRPNASAGLAIRAAYVLPFATILLLWFLIGTRIILKRLSSIQLSVGNGYLKWTQRTFRWTTEISVQQKNVTAVFADGTWYRKALKLKMNGKLYILDDLLEDDLKLLSRELRLRLGIAIAAVDD